MIQNGQMFSFKDLKESMRELRDFKPIKTSDEFNFSDFIHIGRGNLVDLYDLSPDQYAKTQVKLWGKKSSAAALDINLLKRGFFTSHKFSFEHKPYSIKKSEIVYDAYFLEYFYKLFLSENLSPDNDIQAMDDAARLSYYYSQYIWTLNPEQTFDYPEKLEMYTDWGLNLRYLLGVGYKFHPKDIYEFVMNYSHKSGEKTKRERVKNRQKQQAFKDWCKNEHNIDTGCLILSEHSQTKLKNILEKGSFFSKKR